MRKKILYIIVTLVALLDFPKVNFAQAPTMGTSADFVLFSTVGAVTNTGITHLTGHVGTNSGSSTGFGNVDGVMHDQDPASALAATDLLIAYNQLDATVPNFFPGILLGNGQTLVPGVYSIPSPATLNLTLTLDAQGDPNAVFIFQIDGAFASGANAKVKLINGALACNVFWKVEGLVNLAAGTTMRGTIIANNAAIVMNAADTLEGRALSIAGAITVNSLVARKPIGCGSLFLTGPGNPVMGTTACYILFSGIGPVTNTGVTTLTGDVGTNSGLTTGFNPLFVTGMIHPIPDGSTAQCGTDFTNIYNNLNALPHDIELLYPALFGNNLVLTPHTYLMNGAVTFTGDLTLNAQGNPNAVFVIKINGAFSTSTFSNVILTNGAQAKNVYWKIDGATDINDYSIFRGTIISQGAINLFTGVELNGRALTGVGAINTFAIEGVMPSGCSPFSVSNPTNQIVCAGDDAIFSVVATGVGLSYQWRKGSTNLVNGGNVSGANTATLTIDPASILDAANNYNVIVSETFSPNDTSNNVSLTVNTAPVITLQPANVSACPGDSISFEVVASGSGLTYQWRKGLVNLVNGPTVFGATTSTLSIDPFIALDVANNYNVVISGTCAPSVTSNNVSLNLNSAPVITSQPSNVTACVGDSISFEVVASGTGLSYQWRKGIVFLVNGPTISGANTATLSLDPLTILDAANNYNVIISGACSPSVTSNNVSLTVNALPIIISQPSNVNACVGDSISFEVVASGTGLNYQWRKGLVNLVNGPTIFGANTATLSLDPINLLDAANNYNVVISGACSPSVTSNNLTLSVGTAPVISVQPVNVTACSGDSISFGVVATGTGLTYQWRKGIVFLVNGPTISGATTATLSIDPINALDIANNYNVVITGTCSPSVISNNVSLSVNALPVITSQPSNVTACSGDSISFEVVATGTGLTYQWRKGLVNLVNGPTVFGATTATLSLDPINTLEAGNNYNVVISGACSPGVTSNNVSLTVNTAPVITSQPSNVTACSGDSISFEVVATGTGLTYQWRKGLVNLVNGPTVFGATTATLSLDPINTLDAANNYNVIISGSCSPNVNSVNVSLTINLAPSITAQPVSVVACTGDSISFTVAANGTGLTYQWRKGLVNLVNGPTVSGATTATLSLDPINTLDAGNNYNVVISGVCAPSVTSSNVSINMDNCDIDLSITKTASNMTPLVGTNVTFTISTNNTGDLEATNVEVSEALPSGYTFVSYSSTAGTYNNLTGIWTVGNMAAESDAILTIVASVNNAGDYENSVEITSDQFELNTVNNTASVTLVPFEFFIPEGFSPNDDLVNDVFVIRGILYYPSNTFTVFNRWGAMVFTADSYQNTWDGTSSSDFNFGGEVLPVGTYFYVLDLGDGSDVFKGTIYLNN